MENLGIGLQLMIVGMSTVFLILLIVIYGGKLLIMAANRIAPEEVENPKKSKAASPAIDSTTMAILQQTVNQLTGGKAHIASAKKL